MKICNKCKMEKPATSEYFHRNKAREDGLLSICKECTKKNKQKRAKNKKKLIYDDKKVKECAECKMEKQAIPEYFSKQRQSKDGLSYNCKDCDREYREQRKARNEKKKFIYDDKIMKTCTKCEIEKPTTPEYFSKNIQSKDGLAYNCKDCAREYNKQKRAKIKKKIFIYDDKKVKECTKCEIEKPTTPEYFYIDKNKKDGLFNACKECEKKRKQNYREENKEYHSEYNKKYRQENPEVYRLHYQKRRAQKLSLPHDLTEEEWDETLEYFNNECAYCGDSESGLAQEHVIPVSKGGPYTQENIIPACRSCNSSKYTRDLEEWYVSYEHYDEDRLNKILDYIIEEK